MSEEYSAVDNWKECYQWFIGSDFSDTRANERLYMYNIRREAALERALAAMTRRAEQAEAEIAEARNELSQCDDIKLDQSLALMIDELQRDREWLQVSRRDILRRLA